MRSYAASFARYAAGLSSFLRRPLSRESCRSILAQAIRDRERSFLYVLQHGVYGDIATPYRELFRAAGIEHGDVEALVAQEGLEGALGRLYDAGVYITHEEFKGRQPIRRGSLELHVEAEDFDGPLLTAHFEGRTGGSRSTGRRLLIDLELIAHDATYYSVFLDAFAIAGRPFGVWRPTPPDNSGLKRLLVVAKLGYSVDRWFSQRATSWKPDVWRYAALTTFTRTAGALLGRRMPGPEYVPLPEALTVAQWLATMTKGGTPAQLDTHTSSAVRVALAAREHGLDIAGSFFRVGGEPVTASKAQVIAGVGCRVACHYSMSEVGPLAMACADAAAPDDVHVIRSKIALIQRQRVVRGSDVTVPAFHVTTLLPSCPKLMINVESDDYGVHETRRCGCLFGELGLDEHLHTIRSYDKLTSAGITFLGSDLLTLLDDVLPRRFGGGPTDYQLVEEEEGGLPAVTLLVSPRLGPVDEAVMVRTVLERLAARDPGHALMSAIWRDGGTLRIVRREPRLTQSGKILTLHVNRPT